MRAYARGSSGNVSMQNHTRPHLASGPKHGFCRVKRRATISVRRAVDVGNETEVTKKQGSVDKSPGTSSQDAEAEPRSARIKAVAAKISAARQLARKLSDEKMAVMQASDARQAEMLKRQAQLKTSEAALAAARADAMNRLARQKESAKGREAERLAAENEALTAVLMELSKENPALKERLMDIKAKFGVQTSKPEPSVTASQAPVADAQPSTSAPAKAPSETAPSSQLPPSNGLDLLDKLKEMVTRGVKAEEEAAGKAASTSPRSKAEPPTAPKPAEKAPPAAPEASKLKAKEPPVSAKAAPPAVAKPEATKTGVKEESPKAAVVQPKPAAAVVPEKPKEAPPAKVKEVAPVKEKEPEAQPVKAEKAKPVEAEKPKEVVPPTQKVKEPMKPPAQPPVAPKVAPAVPVASKVEDSAVAAAAEAARIAKEKALADEAAEKKRKEEEAAAAAAAAAADAAAAAAAKKRAEEEALAAKKAQLEAGLAHIQKTGSCFFVQGTPRPGSSITVYFDVTKISFKPAQGAGLEVKLGWNKWETIEQVPLTRDGELCKMRFGENLVSCALDLPEDLFGLEFVLVDTRTQLVDNNNGQDFRLALVGAPSEEEVLTKRIMEYEAAEEERLALIEIEETKIWQQVQREARKASDAAIAAWWEARRAQLKLEAKAAVDAAMNVNLNNAFEKVEGVYMFESLPKAGETVKVLYNRDSSELRHCSSLAIHVGCNGWAGSTKQVFQMTKATGKTPSGSQWYEAVVEVPAAAGVLDFVFSDSNTSRWDNNQGRDFHCPVAPMQSSERILAEQKMLKQLTADSEAADIARSRLAGTKAAEKIESKAKARAKRRAMQRKSLYTQPPVPHAGEKVDIYYNPDVTSLRGRPEVWLRGSFNRWTHPKPIEPIKLKPAFPGGIGFMRATIDIPSDAKVIDLVFSDSGSEQGGFYDNNNGLDYHVHVDGGTGVLKQLKVSHIAVEMAPIAKVGGMGDVVTALGRAVREEGHEVEVIIPKYDCLKYNQVRDMREVDGFNYENTRVKVWKGIVEDLPTVFLEPENGMFWVGCIYGRGDDAHRFNFFCQAALMYLRVRNEARSDIVHCHDWQTAPVAFGDRAGAQCVFTIHNLNYGADLIGRAMQSCQVATTVSPTYAQEISGNPSISPHLSKMYGVRNGIDVDIWDPSTDALLPVRYDASTVTEGKRAAKNELRRRMNLSNVDAPIIGVVTRLTHQKGIHLIKHAAWRTLERGGQFVLLGSAPDPRVQADFNALADQLANQYNDRARLCFSFDEPLSHLMYAGCDMLCVPSMFEPCGLTQMIAMRYGTVPIVRKTGGLNDTVFDVDDDLDRAEQNGMQVNGYNFEGTDTGAVDYALNRAISSWYSDREHWQRLEQDIMLMDWSWNDPAETYVELYYKALKGY